MQSLNDDELNRLLETWKAPAAPASLRRKVLSAAAADQRGSWWKWLVRGTVRVPVPILIGLVLLVAILAGYRIPRDVRRPSTLAEFEPVKQLQPRVIRSVYADR